MPYKPKKPCAYRGCSELVSASERYCKFHAKQEAHDYEKYRRNPESRKHYGREWRRIRNRYIRAYPLCEICRADGRLTPCTGSPPPSEAHGWRDARLVKFTVVVFELSLTVTR